MILISNVRTSASKKINQMTLISALTVLTAAFERTKEKFCGFRQTDLLSFNKFRFDRNWAFSASRFSCVRLLASLSGKIDNYAKKNGVPGAVRL